MNIQHVFRAQLVDHTGEGTLTDGGVLWEIVTDYDEHIASCTNEDAAKELERVLNIAVTEWAEGDEADRVVNAL